MLNRAGIITAIITARNNGTVRHRFNILGMTKLYEGRKNKYDALCEFMEEFNLKPEEIAYMGDDLPDICVLKTVGLPCAPSDAVDEILAAAGFVSSKGGGQGAVRELCDLILKSQKKFEVNPPEIKVLK
jgi:3-deoxy-D-manno-octulosonate 8-phosphate phosphatase (KDO 8-P phosphatase)